MAKFSPDFLKFLKDIAANNNREWFEKNKDRYKKTIEPEFLAFIDELIAGMQKYDKRILTTAKECAHRIYKDIRFSADKTPYKTHVSASISPGGKKDYQTPGIYIEINAKQINFYSGVYVPDAAKIKAIRGHIISDLKGFQKLITDKKFVALFGEIKGGKNKRIDKEYLEYAEKEPVLFNKSFYYTCSFPAKDIYEKDLMKKLLNAYSIVQPLNRFFEEAE